MIIAIINLVIGLSNAAVVIMLSKSIKYVDTTKMKILCWIIVCMNMFAFLFNVARFAYNIFAPE